jgi:transposase
MSSRKVYSKEFKEEAIRLAQKGANNSQVARDLGITTGMLTRWDYQLNKLGEKAFPGHGKPENEELYHLKREVTRLKEEPGGQCQ